LARVARKEISLHRPSDVVLRRCFLPGSRSLTSSALTTFFPWIVSPV
jgi:hypothetical protein